MKTLLTPLEVADTDSTSYARNAEQTRIMLDWLLKHQDDRLTAVTTTVADAIGLTFGDAPHEAAHTLKFSDISYCRVQGNYSTLHSELKPILCNNPLTFWEKTLPYELFQRVGKSHLVNIHAIRAVERWQNGKGAMLTMTDGTTIKVSRNYMEKLRERCSARFSILNKYARSGGGNNIHLF